MTHPGPHPLTILGTCTAVVGMVESSHWLTLFGGAVTLAGIVHSVATYWLSFKANKRRDKTLDALTELAFLQQRLAESRSRRGLSDVEPWTPPPVADAVTDSPH